MGLNCNELDENGFALCASCRRKKWIEELEICVACDQFVCKSCATYLRQGVPFYGWVCKKCYAGIKEMK